MSMGRSLVCSTATGDEAFINIYCHQETEEAKSDSYRSVLSPTLSEDIVEVTLFPTGN